MKVITDGAVIIVALFHCWFLVLEMFLWQKPLRLRTFGLGKKLSKDTAVLAKNQGLYNGFLAAGLFFGLLVAEPTAFAFKMFFLIGIILAGTYGALTASPRIFWAQAFPAVVASVLVLIFH